MDTGNTNKIPISYREIYPCAIEEVLGIPLKTVKYLSHGTMIIYRFIQNELERPSLKPSCHQGCWYCCGLNINVHLSEILLIIPYVLLFDKAKYKTLEANLSLWGPEYKKLLDKYGIKDDGADMHKNPKKYRKFCSAYWNSSLLCPFLMDNQCSIYPYRPNVCRTHFSLSPANLCSRHDAIIKRSQYAEGLQQNAREQFQAIEREQSDHIPSIPLGYFFANCLSELSKISDTIVEYSQTVPVDKRPVCIHPSLNNFPISTREHDLHWPIHSFFDDCLQVAESHRYPS